MFPLNIILSKPTDYRCSLCFVYLTNNAMRITNNNSRNNICCHSAVSISIPYICPQTPLPSSHFPAHNLPSSHKFCHLHTCSAISTHLFSDIPTHLYTAMYTHAHSAVPSNKLMSPQRNPIRKCIDGISFPGGHDRVQSICGLPVEVCLLLHVL